MKNFTKGGYQLISLLGIALEATVSPVAFSKDEIKKLQNSNGKRIVLTDLYLDGEKVNDITANLVYDSGIYYINNVYGFNLEINLSSNTIEITEVEDKVGTKLYKHTFSATILNMLDSKELTLLKDNFYLIMDTDTKLTLNGFVNNLVSHLVSISNGICKVDNDNCLLININDTNMYFTKLSDGSLISIASIIKSTGSSITQYEITPL